jgi:hypothetical protein
LFFVVFALSISFYVVGRNYYAKLREVKKPRGSWGFAISGWFGGLTCDFAEDFA